MPVVVVNAGEERGILDAVRAMAQLWKANAKDPYAEAERYNWRAHARAKQIEPEGDWRIWLIRTGRRWGKTRSGAEWVREQVEIHGRRHIALVSDTATDVRHIMVEGPKSGILAISPPWNRPHYEPSKRRLTWPNGAVATTYSAEDPDQLRGPGHDAAWADELAKWTRQREAWDNLEMTLSEEGGRCVVTTTPRPTPVVKELSKREDVVLTLGHMRENAANIDPVYLANLEARHEGTRLGRQELAGELLEDVEGALWHLICDGWPCSKPGGHIEPLRVKKAPDLERVVIAIDPSGSDDEGASEQGIVSVGRAFCDCKSKGNGAGPERHFFVLADNSGHYTPDGWGRRAVYAYRALAADRIVAEANFGGQMVESTIRTIDQAVSYKGVTASRGKLIRAEPVAALSEQGKVHFVGAFPELEDQLCNWVPGQKSPDRLDAYVWGITELDDAGAWYVA